MRVLAVPAAGARLGASGKRQRCQKRIGGVCWVCLRSSGGVGYPDHGDKMDARSRLFDDLEKSR